MSENIVCAISPEGDDTIVFRMRENGSIYYLDEEKDVEINIYQPLNGEEDSHRWLVDGLPNDPVPLRYYNTFKDGFLSAVQALRNPLPPSE